MFSVHPVHPFLFVTLQSKDTINNLLAVNHPDRLLLKLSCHSLRWMQKLVIPYNTMFALDERKFHAGSLRVYFVETEAVVVLNTYSATFPFIPVREL